LCHGQNFNLESWRFRNLRRPVPRGFWPEYSLTLRHAAGGGHFSGYATTLELGNREDVAGSTVFTSFAERKP
jgi:hypothetical protein